MAQAMNPYLPSYEYVPDGEPRIFGDRLYVYGSHDAFDGPDFCVNDYVCWSAPLTDLADWKYEGIIYRADQDPANKKNNMHMCAPDCVQGADGRYYLYYQLHVLTCTSAMCSMKTVRLGAIKRVILLLLIRVFLWMMTERSTVMWDFLRWDSLKKCSRCADVR